MFEMILSDKLFRHPDRKEKIYEVLDDFFATDVLMTEEYEEKKNKVLEALKDEPEILELLRGEL